MTIEMVKNVLERCAVREEAALLDAPEVSWANGFSDGQLLAYRYAIELLSDLEDAREPTHWTPLRDVLEDKIAEMVRRKVPPTAEEIEDL